MKRTILYTLSVCLVAGTLAGQEPVVVARSGDITITAAEIESAVETLPAEYQQYAAGPGKRSFAEDLLRMKALAAMAEKSGVADDPAVRAQLELSRANTLANAQVERMRDSIEISSEEVQKVYDERKGELEFADARHILIAFEGSPAAGEDAPSEEEARAEAEAIHARIASGEDFAAIAREKSDDKGSGARGGDLGQFSRGQMVPAFEQAVFNAEKGALTPVVRTQFGYHVIEVKDRGTVPFEEVREQIETELRQQKLEQKLDGLGAENATFDEAYFGSAPAPAPSN